MSLLPESSTNSSPLPSFVPPTWELPEAIRERLGERAGKQRAIIEDGHLLLILHKLPHADEDARQGAFFWRDTNGDWKGFGSAGLGALNTHLDEYAREVDALDDQLEAAQNATDLFHVLEAAVPLHRAATNQLAALQSARETLHDAHEIISLRDAASDIDRRAELLEIDTRNALEYRIARQTEEQNKLALEMTRASHKLNTLAAIFLPLTAVASVFGMSLKTGLEGAPLWVSWFVIASALLGGWMLRGFMNRNEK